jgi:hypothetical protein
MFEHSQSSHPSVLLEYSIARVKSVLVPLAIVVTSWAVGMGEWMLQSVDWTCVLLRPKVFKASMWSDAWAQMMFASLPDLAEEPKMEA